MTKEQEAIERLKTIDETVEEYGGNILKQDIETVLNMLKEKDKELKKKDKQIDLMLDKINQNYLNIFDKYENNEIKEIYENNKNNIKLIGLEFRKFCIKKYFERKSENGN